MEESVKCDPMSPNDTDSSICNQIIITDLTLSPNGLNHNKSAISPQENSLFAFPNASLSPENVEENDNTKQFMTKDKIDSHIDTLRVPTSNTENTPLLIDDSGLFAYTPKWLRNLCLTPYGILFFLCWASTMQGAIVNGFVSLVVSTLEKRFNINSAKSGNIGGSYDIGFMLAIIPMTYFGGKSNASKPRYIAAGLIILGAGSFLFSLPHFLSEPLSGTIKDESATKMCLTTNGTVNPTIQQTSTAVTDYFLVFVFGQILHGIGAAPILSLGMTLLDETVGQDAAPLYIGIFQIFLVLGPAIGNVAGGRFLESYVDFDRSETPDCGSDDPSWVGAWWLGFIIGGILTWMCSVFLCLYPSKIPKKNSSKNKISPTIESTKVIRDKPILSKRRLTMQISRFSTASNVVKTFDKEGLFNFSGIMKKIWQLLKNPTYVLLCIGGGLDGIVISGLVFFLPKFIQSQFGGTPSDASILMGMVVVPAGGLGTFFGGYIVKRLHMTREQVLRMYIYCQLITIPCSLGFLFHCQNVPFAGINQHYNNLTIEESFNLISTCNNNCGYSNDILCGGKGSYEPVCGSDNIIYFNPCYAGCTMAKEDTSRIVTRSCATKKNYTECRCIGNQDSIPTNFATTDLTSCTYECQLEKIAFMACLFVTIWFTCMSAMPCVACILRFVEPENKSMSMGIANIIVRLIGSIPGPIIFGFIIDRSCVLESGNCLVYDNKDMSFYMMSVTLSAKCMGLLFIILTLISSKWCKVKDEEGINR